MGATYRGLPGLPKNTCGSYAVRAMSILVYLGAQTKTLKYSKYLLFPKYVCLFVCLSRDSA